MHGFQLWVNLPKAAKMNPPRYQELARERIPTVESDGALVRVIAGELGDTKALVSTHIPILFLHVTLAPDAIFSHEIQADRNAFVYVFRGAVRMAGDRVARERMAILGPGDEVEIENGDEESDLLLLAALPINEPVARYGPFVMNDRAGILQAIEDFERGRF